MSVYVLFFDSGKFSSSQLEVFENESVALARVADFIVGNLNNFMIYTNQSEIKEALNKDEVYCALNLYNNSENTKKTKIYLIKKDVQ